MKPVWRAKVEPPPHGKSKEGERLTFLFHWASSTGRVLKSLSHLERKPLPNLNFLPNSGRSPQMERPRVIDTLVISFIVVLLSLVAFSCCIAAEFKKAEFKDLKLDGNLCSLPRTSAFGLGITAMACLSVAQIIGTSAIGSQQCSREKKAITTEAARTRPTLAIILLLLSWVSFGLVSILLGTCSSMNKGQPYGKGWLDNKCYAVNNGVYLGAAALVVVTAVSILGFTFTTRKRIQRTGPEEQQQGRDDGAQKQGHV